MNGAASRDLLEIGKLDLECDCAAPNTRALAVPPNFIDDFLKRITRSFVGEEISAPTDFRIRSARTGRSSMPRAAQ
jgi:hypothetical protein